MGALFSRLSRLSAAQRVGATVFLAVALYQYRRELRRMMGLGARRKRLAPGDRTPGSRGLKATATAAVLDTRGGDTTPTTTTSQRSPAAAVSAPGTACAAAAKDECLLSLCFSLFPAPPSRRRSCPWFGLCVPPLSRTPRV